MVPFRNLSTPAEHGYNNLFTKERVIIERCFGQLNGPDKMEPTVQDIPIPYPVLDEVDNNKIIVIIFIDKADNGFDLHSLTSLEIKQRVSTLYTRSRNSSNEIIFMWNHNLLIFSAVFCFTAVSVNSLKLLLIFPFPAQSHYFLGNELGKGLARLGHDVTIVAPYEEKSPPANYKTIYLSESAKLKEVSQHKANIFDRAKRGSPFTSLFAINSPAVKLSREIMFTNSDFQNLLNSGQKFDAVIVEQFFNDALKVFAPLFNAHLIIFSSVGPNRWVNNLVANPENPSYISDNLLGFTAEMSFFQRTFNLLFGIIHDLFLYQYIYPAQNDLLKKYFPAAPDLDEIMYNVSLVLTNSHESIFEAVPHVPNMIDIGGFHISPPKELPNNIQEYLDEAKEGAIYFSLGSNLVPSNMPKEKKEIILKALGARKEKVLWKWDEDKLENQPKNVKISKWFPQQGILAHPNCKLFITHGGLLSTMETVHLGVPVLALPVFGDQRFNAARITSKGFGLSIPFIEITQDGIDKALDELLENPKFTKAAKRSSELLHDRPIKPIELADYWIKYIVRHNGAPHLRVAGIKLPLYKYYMLDVLGTIGGVLTLSYYLFCKVFSVICKRKIAKKLKKSKKE